MATPADWSASHFRDRVDPSDQNFRIVEVRVPHDPKSRPNYGPFEYLGIAARERIRRFAAAFLQGTGDLSQRDAERIMRRSHAVEDRHS